MLVELANDASLASHRDGAYLWRAGDAATHLCIVQRGLVEVRHPKADGATTLVGLFGPRESLEEVAVLDFGTHASEAIAVSDVEVLRLRAAPVIDALRMAPCEQCRVACVALAVHDSLSVQVELLRSKIDILAAGTVEKRLATLLQHLLDRFGDEDGDGMLRIPVALSRTQLARWVGVRTETVIRVLSRWRRQGWFESNPDGFCLTSSEPLLRILRQD